MTTSGSGAPAGFAEVWASEQRRLRGLAYRIVGSLAEAEDVVQEAYTRLLRAPQTIHDPVGWLVTVTTRLCLDHLRAADHVRRSYVGPWLPEPIVTDIDSVSDPQDRVTLDETVRMALLVVLQELSPPERTALVLHDVFQIPFDEVAEIVGRTPDACRQLASRARTRVQGDAPSRFTTSGDVARRVAERFARACDTGDVQSLVEILDPGAVGVFDSGGLIPGAPLEPLVGGPLIAETLIGTVSGRGATFTVARVNGEPGIIVSLDTTAVAVVSLSVDQGRIVDLHAIGNPAKLHDVNGPLRTIE